MQCCFSLLLKYKIGDWLCLLFNPELGTKGDQINIHCYKTASKVLLSLVMNSDSVHMQCCFLLLLKYMIGDWLCLLSNPELSTKRRSNQYTLLYDCQESPSLIG